MYTKVYLVLCSFVFSLLCHFGFEFLAFGNIRAEWCFGGRIMADLGAQKKDELVDF
jgi:hypothetical protein